MKTARSPNLPVEDISLKKRYDESLQIEKKVQRNHCKIWIVGEVDLDTTWPITVYKP
jgi:hypothetical protein